MDGYLERENMTRKKNIAVNVMYMRIVITPLNLLFRFKHSKQAVHKPIDPEYD
jgi:hypothetical protein